MARVFLICLFLFPLFSHAQFSSIELEVKPVPRPAQTEKAVEEWNQSFPAYTTLSNESKEFLYWVNFCRSNPGKFWDSVIDPILQQFPPLVTPESKSLKADLLRTGPLPMFALNEQLIRAAMGHALDITRKNAPPSHESTNGTGFPERMRQAGIRFCAGENISQSSQGTLLAVVLLYLDIGLPQLGHRKALLNPLFVETGIGSAPFSKRPGEYFLVQDLSCAQK